MTVRTFGEVVPSPDKRSQAWTELGAGKPRLLVNGKEVPEWSGAAANLTWSPDSQYLYFSSGPAFFRVAFTKPDQPGIPERLSRHPGTAGGFRLSPDGKRFVFLERVEARPQGAKSRIRLAGVPTFSHKLCVASSDGKGEAICPVIPDGFVGDLDWDPAGARVAFEVRVSPFADDSRKSDIVEADLATGQIARISQTGAAETRPRYSPDGRYLAFVMSDDPPTQPGDERIILYDRATRISRPLAATEDRLPDLIGWTEDSRRILYAEARGTRNAIHAMPLDGPPVLVLAPDSVASAIRRNATGTAIGLSVEAADRAPEAFVLDLQSPQPAARRLSSVNASLPPMTGLRTEVVWWRSKGNLEVEGLLTYPLNYEAGKKYPMVVILHGGPYGHFDESFIGRAGLYPVASFAAKGYAVFRPNPRASTGYGRDFRFLNLKDWGGGDYEDVVSGVRTLAHIADPARLAIMGWSYGGFLTSWTISHTDMFRAACVGAGVSNLWSQTGTSDIRGNKIEAFGAPWENLPFYVERSPLAHVAKIRIPVLILGGDADERVPISQSYELFHALKRRGVPTELVIYQGAGHVPGDPEFVTDIMERHMNWVDKHLSSKP